MSSTIPRGGLRLCTRSIQGPDRSVSADRLTTVFIAGVIGGSTAMRLASSRMLLVCVLARMLQMCERTVEMATPCSRAISLGFVPPQIERSTLVSAPVSPWVRA